MDFVVWLILGLVFVIVSIARHVMQATAERERQNEPEEKLQGSRDQVREFLEELMRGRQQAAVPVREAPPAPSESARPVTLPRPVEPVPMPAPQVGPPVARRPRKPKARERPAPPAQPPVTPAKQIAPTVVRLADTDLKKAVVWAEILGWPVSVQRRIGHRPVTFKR